MTPQKLTKSLRKTLRSVRSGSNYLHGVEHIWMDDASGQPISVMSASVYGMVAISEDADPDTFPLDKPVMVNSDKYIAKAGTGPLRDALEDIYRQAGAIGVVIRVSESSGGVGDPVVGTVGDDGEYTGLQAMKVAESETGLRPTLLMLATGKQETDTHKAALEVIANELHAVPFASVVEGGPQAAIAAAEKLDGWILGYDMMQFGEDAEGVVIERYPTATMVGHVIRVDGEEGYWNSPSSRKIYGLTGMRRPVDHAVGSSTTTANLLSEKQVCCVVAQDGGFYWWGNMLTGPKKMLIPHQRIRWIVGLSIQQAHSSLLDRNITSNYVENVKGRVNHLLRRLTQREVILGGSCWVDKELNVSLIGTNQCVWDYELSMFDLAQTMTFRQSVTRERNETVFG